MPKTDNIKIAFFDIDGTLVSFSTHRIPDSAIKSLNRLADNGIEIVIATGRGAEPIAEIADVPYSAIIGLNGSECVTKDGKVLYRHQIPPEMFERVLSLGKEYGFAVAAKFKEGFVVDRITHRVKEMAERIASPYPPVRDLREIYLREGTGQMCIFTDPDTEKAVMDDLPDLISSRWCETFADLNLRGIDKGSGVREYLRLRGLLPEKAISFGDGGNDIALLKSTGIGVAMGNAREDLKNIADHITDDIDNDGLLNAFRHYGLI